MVVGGGEEVAGEVGVPGESVALLGVSLEAELGAALAGGVGLEGVLGVVEEEDVRGRRLRRDQHRVLGHVAGPVHLPLVVHLHLDVDLTRDVPEAPELPLHPPTQSLTEREGRGGRGRTFSAS